MVIWNSVHRHDMVCSWVWNGKQQNSDAGVIQMNSRCKWLAFKQKDPKQNTKKRRVLSICKVRGSVCWRHDWTDLRPNEPSWWDEQEQGLFLKTKAGVESQPNQAGTRYCCHIQHNSLKKILNCTTSKCGTKSDLFQIVSKQLKSERSWRVLFDRLLSDKVASLQTSPKKLQPKLHKRSLLPVVPSLFS